MAVNIYYYDTWAAAFASNPGTEIATNSIDWEVGIIDAGPPNDLQGFTKWLVAKTDSSPSGSLIIYDNGQTLTPASGIYYLYPVRVLYYNTRADAQTGGFNYTARNLGDYQAGGAIVPGGTVNDFTRWFVDRTVVNNIPTSGPTNVYPINTFLTATTGIVYYLYPARVVYYNNKGAAAAEGSTNIARNFTAYEIGADIGGSLNGFSSWIIDHTTSDPAPAPTVYANGTLLTDLPQGVSYFLYPSIPCFLEGTRILCQVDGKEEHLPVEELRKGTLVKTSRDGFKAVELIGKRTIANSGTSERTEERLYKCSKAVYPELTEDLIVTGCHSILVDTLTDVQREATLAALGKIFVTDRKYRLMAHIDERAEPWASAGDHTVWHFALENEDDGMNYGVYANGGLLVETCSIRFLKNRSNMTLL
jgi:hypothetical protein